ncbi:hypothetical protein BC828DRAFT_385228 [Blastocladiella britannica]|nr:hypothetical protein BC828DRAFT_385228 [Blastocladiella britannica]
MYSKSLLFALLALAASSVNVAVARPNGAPACIINEAKITAGMGAAAGDRNFKLTPSAMTYTPGQPITMKLTSDTAATKTFKGVMIYVQPASDAKKRVGSFKIPDGFHSNVDKCAAIQATGETDSVITHSSSADKQLGMDFTWTAPASAMGELHVMAIVAGTGPKNWQVLPMMKLMPAGGSGEMPASNGGYGTGGGQKRCKKWRTKTMMGGSEMPAATTPAAGGYGYGGSSPAVTSAPAEGGMSAPASSDGAAPATSAAAEGAAPTSAAPADGAAAAPAPTDGGSQAPASAGGSVGQASSAERNSAAGVAVVAAVAVAAMLL